MVPWKFLVGPVDTLNFSFPIQSILVSPLFKGYLKATQKERLQFYLHTQCMGKWPCDIAAWSGRGENHVSRVWFLAFATTDIQEKKWIHVTTPPRTCVVCILYLMGWCVCASCMDGNGFRFGFVGSGFFLIHLFRLSYVFALQFKFCTTPRAIHIII